MLPTHLKVEIDISVALHKRAVSEAFEEARAKLLPEPEPHPLANLLQPLMNAQSPYMRQMGLAPAQNPFLALPDDVRNAWPAYTNSIGSVLADRFFGQVFR